MSLTSTIETTLAPASAQGRLYPRYLADSNLIAVESRVRREWPHGVNVDNTVIFDLDRDRTLANFDIHWSGSEWPIGELPARPPQAVVADLRFTEATCTQKFFDLPVELMADESRSRVTIQLGDAGDGQQALELSPYCLALVCDGRLTGFDILLGRFAT